MKYFAISDVHSYYSIMKKALADAGFDEKNKDHKIILCGDAFDRGNESKRMFSWLKKLAKNNKLIYIRGNHEDLLLKMLSSRPGYHDITNGTYSTVMQLGGAKHNTSRDKMLKGKIYYYELSDLVNKYSDEYTEAVKNVKESGLCEFINDNCVDFYETDHYIFTHGWITGADYKNAPAWAWNDARWENGMDRFLGYDCDYTLGKTVVVGHWHCNWLRDLRKPEEECWKDFSIEKQYKANGDGCIAIDTCTAFSKKVNVLVIDD